jgi:phosphoserine aminotransferase
VDVLVWESFSKDWATDILKQLKLADARVLDAPYGKLPDLGAVDPKRDVVFVWNGTTSGVRLKNADFISADREGLAICDATSAAFAMDLPFAKLDVVTWSWQKVLGGEAAHGMLALSPRAVARLESYSPPWPMPKIFRLSSGGKLSEGIFKGETINTPSMLCVEDALDGLRWAESVGGLQGLIARSEAPWFAAISTEAQAMAAKKIASLLEKEGVALDASAYRDAPPGLRIWGGATVETSDIKALLPWLDWALASVQAEMAGA